MPQHAKPRLLLPTGFQAKSGLYLPTALQGLGADQIQLPPELEPRVDLIVAGRMPSFFEQVFVYVTEDELGLTPTPAADVQSIVEAIPFWASIRLLSRFQRDLWNARVDPEAHIALLRQWYGGSEFGLRAEAWMRNGAQRVLFSEQQVYALQRLVMLHSYDGPLDEPHSPEQYLALLIALAAVPGSVLGPQFEPQDHSPVEDEDWMRLFVGHGGFIGRGSLRNEIGRSYRLFIELAQSERARGLSDYCPLDEWLRDEFGLTSLELLAFGFALHAGSKMLSASELPSLIGEDYFNTTALSAKARSGLDALSASREWFAERFRKTQGDRRRAIYEITPFLQRPALRQPDGMVMPIAPRALEAWMGATGSFYRLFDLSRKGGSSTRKRFTRFVGMLTELYAVNTVEAAFPEKPESALVWLPGRVYRDHAYRAGGGERRTPDIAIDLTPDLILFEVTGSRLTEKSLVDGDPESVRQDIKKVLIEKVIQLGAAIDDFLAGTATLPGLDISQVDRIWPIVVSSEGIFQTPILWGYVSSEVGNSLSRAKVQPLTLFDLEDLEEFAGLLAQGYAAVDILRDKTSTLWQQLEFSAWFRAVGAAKYSDASPVARAGFEAGVSAAVRLLLGDAAAAERT